ncbi:hypothetical protein L580_0467 [Serratia fonticola AU-P3(3)]|nr:hypothetical protein L580_0467 [Serratia fonticola AU-P3(3)]
MIKTHVGSPRGFFYFAETPPPMEVTSNKLALPLMLLTLLKN